MTVSAVQVNRLQNMLNQIREVCVMCVYVYENGALECAVC